MIFNKQLFFHKPEAGEYGDCDRTCFACLLNLSPEWLPNWGEHYDDSKKFFEVRDESLLKHGYAVLDVPWNGCSLEDFLTSAEHNLKNKYYILSGESRNKTCHSVVCCGGEIIWDPSKDDSGIVGPYEGFYWTSFLTSSNFVKQR